MGRNIKFLSMADQKGLSQREIAFRVGIPESKLSEILRGYSKPSNKEVMKICRILDCDPIEIGLCQFNDNQDSTTKR